MVENSNDAPRKAVKLCQMRHGETSYIAEYVVRKNARIAAGIDENQLTQEEIKQREIDHNRHALQAKFIDDFLTEAGCQMCMDNLPRLAETKLHRKVFVSPFRRTIQSACHLLNNHPDKENLTICLTVGPLEHLGFKNTLLLHGVALKKYCNEMSEKFGVTIDCSFLGDYSDQKWWFLELIPDAETRAEIKDVCVGAECADSDSKDYDLDVYEALKTHFLTVMQGHREPEPLEDFITRGMAFQRFLRSYGQENVAGDETILVVTHSRMINVILETLTKDEVSGKYQWGTHTEVADMLFSEL